MVEGGNVKGRGIFREGEMSGGICPGKEYVRWKCPNSYEMKSKKCGRLDNISGNVPAATIERCGEIPPEDTPWRLP